ncbi:unnamed protein product [Leuciscus chuanchicus]
MVQNIIGADSPVLSGICGGLESEAEPVQQCNTEPLQHSEKQLQHHQIASRTPIRETAKTPQTSPAATTREDVLELQREVLQLQKDKLQLDIQKLKKEMENQELYHFILNNKLLQLKDEGKITITEIE